MKKFIPIIAILLFSTIVHAEDRIYVQIQFREAIWTCPVCQVEEFEDRPMEGGASYEHTCKNGHKFNQSGSNMREYNGIVNYTPKEYETLKPEDLAKVKQAKVDEWLYRVKNPAPYVESTYVEELNLYKEKAMELTQQLNKVLEKATDITKLQELKENVSDLQAKDQIENKITELKQ